MIFIGVFFLAIFLLLLLWLRVYTHHGQKLELPDFIGMEIDQAKELASDKTFEIIVNDSVHIIGKSGGEIIDQNPKPSSKVKEKRKVYVTTTKFIADRMKVRVLPVLYGRDFERKQKELAFMDIKCDVKDYIYDPGEPNHILEVYYQGQKIISSEGRLDDVDLEKGGTLEFVLSKRYGGEMSIPNVVCMDFQAATFLIENLRLTVGNVTAQGNISDRSSAYVLSQSPEFQPEGFIQIGDTLNLIITQELPVNCN